MPNSFAISDYSKYYPKLAGLTIEQVAKNLLAGAYAFTEIDLVLRLIAQSGYRFSTTEELLGLNRTLPEQQDGLCYAHILAKHGYVFDVPQILLLGNPRDRFNRSLAHYLAAAGCSFTPDEIHQLGSPIDSIHVTLVQEMGNYRAGIQPHQEYENRVVRAKSFRLAFAETAPVFIEGTRTAAASPPLVTQAGSHLNIDFIQYERYDDWFFAAQRNSFQLHLEPRPSGWLAGLREGPNPDAYFRLVQRIAVLQIVDRLNQALRRCQPLDFSDAYPTLFHLCDRNLEMKVATSAGEL